MHLENFTEINISIVVVVTILPIIALQFWRNARAILMLLARLNMNVEVFFEFIPWKAYNAA